MTADEWKSRLVAVNRAATNGDPEPLALLCERIAELEANVDAEQDAETNAEQETESSPIIGLKTEKAKRKKLKLEAVPDVEKIGDLP